MLHNLPSSMANLLSVLTSASATALGNFLPLGPRVLLTGAFAVALSCFSSLSSDVSSHEI